MQYLSVTRRAALAVILMAGFYLFALALAGGLLYIPYAAVVYGDRIPFKLLIGCVGGAAVILWSIIPRIDKFIAPGPELLPEKHPELFKQIREIAERTNQEPPASVYIVPEMNAWVAQRGGIMGFGSSRVMGIGLPLLQVTSVSQFKAILAHEFGHYYGGDTRIGPWIYKTREAIARTLQNLGDGSWLQKPFIGYGNLFLRITHAVSRRQEYTADRLSAQIYGPDAAIGGLKAVYGHAASFTNYWYGDVAPVLGAGRKPPLTEGFQIFLTAPLTTKSVAELIEGEMKDIEENPYQTHPTLPRRIAALESLPKKKSPENDPAAISLLRDLPAIETELLTFIVGEQNAQELKMINWGSVGSDLYIPLWEKKAEAYASVFRTMTAEKVADAAIDLETFGEKFVEPGEPELTADERQKRAAGLLGAALALTLYRQGWAMRIVPGEEVTLERHGFSVQPFAAVRRLADGTMKRSQWQRQCTEYGIADMALLP